MDVHRGGVPAGEVELALSQAILADLLAHGLGAGGVPGGGDDDLGAPGVGLLGDGDARGAGVAHVGRAVDADRRGRADRAHGLGLVATHADEAVHLLGAQLVEKVVPGGVFGGGVAHHGQGQAVLGARRGHGGVGVVRTLLDAQGSEDLGGRLEVVGRGVGAGPVAAGEVDKGGVVAADVCVLKLVGDRDAGVGRRLVRVAAGKSELRGLGGVAGGVGARDALGGKDVVEGVVGIGADGQVIVAGLEDVGATTSGVIALEIGKAHLDLDGLGRGGRELVGLGKAHELDRGLLHAVLAVVVGVGALPVHLDDVTAGDGAGVSYLDGQRGHAVLLDTIEQLLLEGGVGEAEAKRELHGVGVAPGAGALGSAHGGLGVALAQDAVLVSGLVVLVADVDSLLVDHERSVVGAGHDVLAEVLERRSRERVVRVGVDGPAGGAHGAGEDVAHGIEAVLAGVADPQAGVHAVGGLVKEGELHGVAGVDQHDDLVEALGHVGQQRLLGGGELEVVAAEVGVGVQAVGVEVTGIALDVHVLQVGLVIGARHVGALGAGTGEGHDGGVGVLRQALLLGIAEELGRGLVDDVATGARDVGDVHADGACGALGVEAPHGGVDLEAGGLERLLERGGRRGVHGAGATAAIEDGGRAYAEERHLARGQGQRAVVLEKDEALLGRLSGSLGICRQALVRAAVGRLEVLVVLGAVAGLLDLVGLLAEIGGDDGRVLVGVVVAHAEGGGANADAAEPKRRAPGDRAGALLLVSHFFPPCLRKAVRGQWPRCLQRAF